MSESIEKKDPPPKSPSRLRRLGRKLLFVAAFLLIGLVVAELIVRWVAPQVMIVPMLESNEGLPAHRPHIAGRGYVPGQYDVTYHTNSQRFRGQKDFALQPPPGITRIIALGDSFCFGIGVEDDQAFPEVMEKLLQQGGKKVEVINAGVGAASTGSQALWYDSVLAGFNPKIVVVVVYVNTIKDGLTAPYFTLNSAGEAVPLPREVRIKRDEKLQHARERINRVPGYVFLTQHSHLANLLRRMASGSMSGGKPTNSEDQIKKEHEQFIAQGVPLFDAELRWFKQRVESSGGKLVVAWFPTRETIYPDTGPFADENRWLANSTVTALGAFAARENVPFLEPTAKFKQRAAAMPTELYFKGADRHANADGYRLFAEEVSALLLNSKLLSNQQ